MDVEQRARELLAQAFACEPEELLPVEVRAVRAVLAYHAALTPPEGYVLVPVERGAMYVCPTCHGVGSVTQQVHDQMLAARPEVKND